MTTLAVVGATGLAGGRVCRHAESAGHRVVRLSRAFGVDLVSGEGLLEALRGVDLVVDASNVGMPGQPPEQVLPQGMGHLTTACTTAGVQRVVLLSINGIDDPGFDAFPYYVAKRAQERVLRESGLSCTIVRSTQWFEFALNQAAVNQSPQEVVVQDWLVQPVAVDAVAGELVAACSAHEGTVTVAGPEVLHLPELTERVLRAAGDERHVRRVAPGLPALASGALLAPPGAKIVGPSLDGWLVEQAAGMRSATGEEAGGSGSSPS